LITSGADASHVRADGRQTAVERAAIVGRRVEIHDRLQVGGVFGDGGDTLRRAADAAMQSAGACRARTSVAP
jgi:hypothetical protein